MDATSTTATLSAVKIISGIRLAKRVADLNPTHCALLAHELESGGVQLRLLTRTQALSLTKASNGYVTTVARLTPQQRVRVENGWLALASVHQQRRTPSNPEIIDRIVVELGVESVMSALDRLTQPVPLVAAE
jgi:hypothetical protein